MAGLSGYGPNSTGSKGRSRFQNLCFDGSKESYPLWETKLLAYMLTQNTEAYDAITAASVSDEQQPANKIAYAEVVQLLDDKSLQMIMHDAKDDGNRALQILRSQFASTEKPRILSLYTDLTTLKMKTTEDVTDYLIRAENAATGLKSAGENISDNLVIAMILNGLSDAYHTFVVVQSQTETVKTIAELKSRLINFSNSELVRSEKTTGIMRTTVQPRNDNRTCYACGHTGHISRNCQVAKETLKCQFCGLNGHVESVCLKKKRVTGSNGVAATGTGASSVNSTSDSAFVFSAVVKSASDLLTDKAESTGDLLVDCGASHHIVNDKNAFVSFDKSFSASTHSVELADGHRSNTLITHRGDACVSVLDANGNRREIQLRNALCAPSFPTSLFSVKAATNYGAEIYFGSQSGKLTASDGTVFPFSVRQNLYYFANKVSSSTSKSLYEWHRVLCHTNYDDILKLQSTVIGLQISDKSRPDCEACFRGKQKRDNIPREKGYYATAPLEMVQVDLCGPISPKAKDGFEYMINFIDEYSSMSFVYLLKTKNAAKMGLQQFLADVAVVGTVKEIHADNGGEFIGSEFSSVLIERGIKFSTSVPYSPHQNGKVERTWQTVANAARAILLDSNLDKTFWGYAAKYVCYVKNRSLIRHEGKTPFELFTGKVPSVEKLQIFGSKCTYYDESPKGKLDARSRLAVFLGVNARNGGQFVKDEETGTVKTSGNVKFFRYDDTVTPGDTRRPYVYVEDSEEPDSDFEARAPVVPDPLGDNEVTGRPQRDRRPPDRYAASVINAMACSVSSVSGIPLTYEQATLSTDSNNWKQAMDKEIEALKDNNTWVLTPLPPGRSEIRGKWIYTMKYKADGTIEKYKARYVARGFTQIEGVDYSETFSPTTRMTTVRMLLQVAAQYDLHLHQLDVKTAYLNAPIDAEIYVEQPRGYEVVDKNGRRLSCKLLKSLYGLKQSGRNWNDLLSGYLISQSFVQSQVDKCFFRRGEGQNTTYIIFWVDDIIIAAKDVEYISAVIEELKSRFKMDDRGEMRWFLGFEVIRSVDHVGITQKQYIEKMLDKFEMADCKPVDTPAVPKPEIIRDQKETTADGETNFDYRGAVGSLLYLAITSRPDISWAVNNLSKYMNDFKSEHVVSVKRVFRYLQGTKSIVLKYYRTSGPLGIDGYCDADWGSSEDRRSTTGYLFRLGSGTAPISWASRRQRTVALSSCEAEYMALSDTVKEAIFLKQLLDNVENAGYQMKIHCDNQGAIALARNPVHHQRSKHIDIRYHFIREYFESAECDLEYVSSEGNYADILTKALGKLHFRGLFHNLFL